MGLDELLLGASEAPPDTRIELRDPIAAHGVRAIDLLMGDAWIGDPLYAGFAIQTIKRAGQLGAREEAVDALLEALSRVQHEWHVRDIEGALVALNVSHRAGARASRSGVRSSLSPRSAIALVDLVPGACYRRSALHDGGLGGNRQKGISYPANGTYCLLFSDASKARESGYRDEPVGDDGYRYFGEWDGPGDMTLSGGNLAVVERSPELYLFTSATCGRVFRGRFRCASWAFHPTVRDGREDRAIVFDLERMKP